MDDFSDKVDDIRVLFFVVNAHQYAYKFRL